MDGSADASADSGARDDAASDASSGPVRFSLTTWNVRNLFDSTDDPDTDEPVPSATEVERKVTDVGRVLRSIDADVIVLQEVENTGMLERLAEGPLEGRGYDELGVQDAGDPRGIDVGYLSRLPVTRVVSHRDELFSGPDGSTYGFARDALEVFVEVGGKRVIVITVHLRAQRDGDEADAHRLAEADKLRRIVDTRLGQGAERIMVAGDLNAEPGSRTLQALLEGDSLTDVTRRVPRSDRWTFVFDNQRVQLDYVLASPGAEDTVNEVSIVHGPEVDRASDHEPIHVQAEL
jgi:endonuclease/exonuclease/phosphatase family metal-dependent hydrolase